MIYILFFSFSSSPALLISVFVSFLFPMPKLTLVRAEKISLYSADTFWVLRLLSCHLSFGVTGCNFLQTTTPGQVEWIRLNGFFGKPLPSWFPDRLSSANIFLFWFPPDLCFLKNVIVSNLVKTDRFHTIGPLDKGGFRRWGMVWSVFVKF